MKKIIAIALLFLPIITHGLTNSIVMIQDSIKRIIIEEVDRYITNRFPAYPDSVAELIVIHGLENDIDICFMMAQSQIETGFGTAGVGRSKSRKSLFGVCVKYKSYNRCVEHYIETLRKYYLVRGRTVHDLMRNYATPGGKRYADCTKYESKLRRTYSHISRNTKIKDLQKEYNEL